MSVPALGGESTPKTACITLDLENNWDFESDDLRYLVFDHLDEYIELIQSVDVPVTVFVVGEVCEDRPDVIRRLDSELDVEFQLHSYSHDMTGEADIEREIRAGVSAFEAVRGHRPRGYRAPRFIVDDGDLRALADAGFTFDSSICPSYRPGVYNNLDAPQEPHTPSEAPGLLEFPIGVHPQLKIPISQSYLRLLGSPYLQALRYTSLPDPLVVDSHLHDFFETDAHAQLSGLRKLLFTTNIDSSTHLFRRLVGVLREQGYAFRTLGDLVDERRPLQARG
jgi:peptidoglycan/xylan/chitin deacetylase (PgdA/CDA1 family)